MLKKIMILLIVSWIMGFTGTALLYADTDNDVYFTYPNGDIALQSVGNSSTAFVNWSNNYQWGSPNMCPMTSERGTAIGIATADEAEIGTTYNAMFGADGGTVSCIYDTDDLVYDDSDHFHVACGRTDSLHVAFAYDSYMGALMETSSHVLHANQKAFENNNGLVANGFPTQLNFFFVVDLQFSVNSDWYTCPNVAFGQVSSNTKAAPNWGATIAKQAVGLIVPATTCIVTLGDDCFGLVKALFKDAITDIEKEIIFAASEENTWWVGQSYNNSNANATFTLPPNSGASTGADAGNYQVAIFCQNQDSPSDQTFLILSRDGDSDDTFTVVAATPQNLGSSD